MNKRPRRYIAILMPTLFILLFSSVVSADIGDNPFEFADLKKCNTANECVAVHLPCKSKIIVINKNYVDEIKVKCPYTRN